jgi:hypothetical protein
MVSREIPLEIIEEERDEGLLKTVVVIVALGESGAVADDVFGKAVAGVEEACDRHQAAGAADDPALVHARELLSRVSPLLPNLTTLVCEDIPNLNQGELEAVLKAAPPGLQRLRVPASNLPLKFAQRALASTRRTLTLELSYGDCSIEVSGAGVRRIDDSPDSEVERLISERLQALGLREVELERRGAAQRAPLHYTADVRFYPAVEPAPIRVRVSTAPPPPPPPPGSAADWD